MPGRPRHKVLLGLNFYGHEFAWKGKLLQTAEPVLASRLLEVLRSYGGSSSSGSGEGSGSGRDSEGGAAGECRDDGGSSKAGSCSADPGSSGVLRIEWLADAREHLFRWREPVAESSRSSSKKKRKGLAHRLYFPTPRALAERLAAADARGMGAAVWEVGQGVDAFCGLL